VPRLSILIPALDGDFEDTLASVLQHRPDDSEVIVAHARPYDDPYQLSGEVCFVARRHASQQVELLNAGFEAARSSIVHVVQCGLTVADGWTDAAIEHFEQERTASVVPVIVAAESPERIVSAGLGYTRGGRVFACSAGRPLDRKRVSSDAIGPTIAAGFYRRSWWRLVRWDESLGDDFADAHFNLTIAALGGQTVLEPECQLRDVDCGTLAADEPYGFRTARQAERLFWSHTQSLRTVGTVSLRVLRMLGEAVLALPSPRAVTGMLGRLTGLAGGAQSSAFRAHLEELTERLAASEAQAAAASTLSLDEARRRRSKPANIKKQAA
jgi:hypothetical protein